MGETNTEIDPDTLQTREESWTQAHEQYDAQINSGDSGKKKGQQPKSSVKKSKSR